MRREQRKRGGICQSHSSISVTLRPLWLLLRGVLIEPLHLLGYAHLQDPKFVINVCPLFVESAHLNAQFLNSFSRLFRVLQPENACKEGHIVVRYMEQGSWARAVPAGLATTLVS